MHARDVIVELNGEPVESPMQLRDMIRLLGPRGKELLGIIRDGKPDSVELTLSDLAAGTEPSRSCLPNSKPLRIEELEQKTIELERRVRELERLLHEATSRPAGDKKQPGK